MIITSMNKGFSALIIILLILFVGTTFAGGFIAYQQIVSRKKIEAQEVKTPEEIPGDEIDNWKTYTSEELALSIKYPPNWTWKQFPLEETDGTPNVVFGNKETAPLFSAYVEVEDTNSIQILRFQKSSLQGFFNPLNQYGQGRVIELAGEEGRQFDEPLVSPDQPGVSYLTTLVERSDDLFVIEGNLIGEFEGFGVTFRESKEKLKEIYNKMLLSLKFTELEEQEETKPPKNL